MSREHVHHRHFSQDPTGEFTLQLSDVTLSAMEAFGIDASTLAAAAAKEAVDACEERVRDCLPLDEAPYFHCGLVAVVAEESKQVGFHCELANCLGKHACATIPRRQAVMAARQTIIRIHNDKLSADARQAAEIRNQQME